MLCADLIVFEKLQHIRENFVFDYLRGLFDTLVILCKDKYELLEPRKAHISTCSEAATDIYS